MSKLTGRAASLKRGLQARRAAAAVFIGVAVFVLLQLGFAVGLETWLPQIRDPLYGGRLARVERRLHAAPVKPLSVLMLGSSRTYYGFFPRDVEKSWDSALGQPVAAFNFGIKGGGPLKELLTWRRLQRDGVRPDLLLVEVLPTTLAAQVAPEEFSDVQLPVDALAWKDLPLVERYTRGARPGLRADWLRRWPLPWYTLRINLISLMGPNLLPPAYRRDDDWKVDASGGLQLSETLLTPEQRVQARRTVPEHFRPYLTGFRLGGPKCEALRELLASCRHEGVPAAMVLMPEGPAFRSIYPPEFWPVMQAWLEQVSQEENAPVINAREWIDEEGFMDSNHLVARGAAEFTEKLGRECIVPTLRRAILHSAPASVPAPATSADPYLAEPRP